MKEKNLAKQVLFRLKLNLGSKIKALLSCVVLNAFIIN